MILELLVSIGNLCSSSCKTEFPFTDRQSGQAVHESPFHPTCQRKFMNKVINSVDVPGLLRCKSATKKVPLTMSSFQSYTII